MQKGKDASHNPCLYCRGKIWPLTDPLLWVAKNIETIWAIWNGVLAKISRIIWGTTLVSNIVLAELKTRFYNSVKTYVSLSTLASSENWPTIPLIHEHPLPCKQSLPIWGSEILCGAVKVVEFNRKRIKFHLSTSGVKIVILGTFGTTHLTTEYFIFNAHW